MDAEIEKIAGRIADGGCNVVFSGAGISTESGIPDYRSQGGLWDRFEPIWFDDFMRSQKAREAYWRQKTLFYEDLVKAEPNAAHKAVYALYALGRLDRVITQNIDGLHQLAGMPADRVIELHGSNRRARCMSCGRQFPIAAVQARVARGERAPQCRCGGYLKPDTISFGQAMPAAEVETAVALARRCDVFLVVGSTLLVEPASLLPRFAKQAGAYLAIINLSETPCDRLCDVCIRVEAGEALTRLVCSVRRRTAPDQRSR